MAGVEHRDVGLGAKQWGRLEELVRARGVDSSLEPWERNATLLTTLGFRPNGPHHEF